jgi:NADH-quinone oxidoreductase subunit A
MTSLVFCLLVFLGVGTFFLFIHLMMGKVIRPAKPESEKLTIYECGEPTVGSAWIQFDLRYYVVALLFVVFDVEVAFFFPWAVVFGNANALAKLDPADEGSKEKRAQAMGQLAPAALPSLDGKDAPAADIDPKTASSWAWISFLDILVFFGVLMVGFAYLWRRGDIDWVRSTAAEKVSTPMEELPVRVDTRELVESK